MAAEPTVPRGESGVGTYTNPQGVHRGHDVVQVGMSDDGLPYFGCRNRGCQWRRVGGLPDHLDRLCEGRYGCAICQPYPGDPCVCGWDG